MNPIHQHQLRLTRRALFGNATRGLGALALASLITPSLLKAASAAPSATGSKLEKWPGLINPPHVPPRIKRVLTNDPMMGIFRHADAGYDLARQCADEQGVKIPMG